MSGATFSDLETWGMLKELYSDDVTFQEHVQSSLKNFIREAGDDEVEFDGNYWNVPAQFQINTSYAALNDDEHLPESRIPKGVFAKYRTKLMYSGLEATVFAGTRGHKSGRPNGKYLDDLIKGTLLNMMANLDWDLYGNGRGKRAVIATATPGAANFIVVSSAQLLPGAVFDWYDSTLATKRGSIAIDVKSVDRQNRRVYIDATFGSGAVPAAATAGDILVVYGALAPKEPTDGRRMAGLERLTDNTLSLGGLASSTYAAWMATNINAAGANPSQELLQLHWDTMYIIAGMYPSKMAFNPAWKRSYLSPFLTQRRFTSNSFDTGATNVTFSPTKMGKDEKGKKPQQVEMLEDKNCPATLYYLWCDPCLMLATDYSSTPHLADEDGKEMRFRLGYDALAGFYRYWANTVVKQRNGIGTGYGFATPTGVI